MTSGPVLNGLNKIVAMAIFTPATGPVQGVAVLQTPHRPPGPPSNAVLNLSLLSTDESRVLPTKLVWQLNPELSTGIFKNGMGEGVAYLQYSNNSGRGGLTPGFIPGEVQRGLVAARFSDLIHPNVLIQNLIKGEPG